MGCHTDSKGYVDHRAMEMPPLLIDPSARERARRQEHLDSINADLERAQVDITAVIAQVASLRNDEDELLPLLPERRSLFCWCCRRRDLRKLEDRLWARLHLLQEKENELHRQKTAILSRSLPPADEPQPAILPPSVSPDAPASPLWQHQNNSHSSNGGHQQQQQQRRTTEQSRSSEEHHYYPRRQLLPPMSDLDLGASRAAYYANLPVAQLLQQAAASSTAQQVPPPPPPPPPPVAATIRLSSVRRRPNRPGSAEDTGSGAE